MFISKSVSETTIACLLKKMRQQVLAKMNDQWTVLANDQLVNETIFNALSDLLFPAYTAYPFILPVFEM